MTLERGFVGIPAGSVHYAAAGPLDAPVVLLLHQTPRSWAEYRDVLPLLGGRYRAIAVDTPGFGDSSPPPEPSIEAYARSAGAALDALGIERAAVVGHHTGGVIAIELAAARPELVSALVLSATPLVDAEFRRDRAEGPAVDHVERPGDGTHLLELWRGREAFYPPGRPELLEAFVLDALKAGDGAADGHRAVAAYAMEPRLGSIAAPALLIEPLDDPFAAPHGPRLARALPGSRVVGIPGGMVPLPDQLPKAFADAVLAFLDEVVGAAGR